MTNGPWSVIVPVKRLTSGKSRLAGSRELRTAVATALARDTMDTVAGCAEVDQLVVVTSDGVAAEAASAAGAVVVCERQGVRDPLNEALESALRWLRTHRPDFPVAVVPTDLASLTAPVLAQVLREARLHERAFVRDVAGTGTTIWTSRSPRSARTHYGAGSAEKHLSAGAADLAGLPLEARHDLDRAEDVTDLLALGVGPHLRHALNLGGQPPGSVIAFSAR